MQDRAEAGKSQIMELSTFDKGVVPMDGYCGIGSFKWVQGVGSGNEWMNEDILQSANQSMDIGLWQKVQRQESIWRQPINGVEVQQPAYHFLSDWDGFRRLRDKGTPSNSWYESTHVREWTSPQASAYSPSWGIDKLGNEALVPGLKRMQLKHDLTGSPRTTEQFFVMLKKEDFISSLPDDMLEKIFALLPLLSLLRATAVCKRWKAIISSQSFTAVCALSPPHQPWYLMYRDTECSLGVAYDPSAKKWHQFSFPPYILFAICVASSNGLACFMDKSKCDVMYVCNPITKIGKKLPEPPSSWTSHYTAVEMIVNRVNLIHKVIVARSTPTPGDYNQWHLSIEVYDSVLDCWKTSNTRLMHGWRGGRESKICKGILYCVSQSTSIVAMGPKEPRHGLIAYDLSSDEFLENLLMPCSLSCVRLVSCKDGLFMVGGIGAYDFIKGVGIWEFNGGWKQICRMPTKLFHGFSGGLDDVFSCSGQEDLIYIHSYGSPQLMVYNLKSRSWYWAKTCPVLKRDPHDLFTGFCLEPRLNAIL